MKRRRRLVLGLLGVAGALFCPPCPVEAPAAREPSSFAWNADATFERLGARFDAARTAPCPSDIASRVAVITTEAQALGSAAATADDARWDQLLSRTFELTADLPACADAGPRMLEVRNAVWRAAKAASVSWNDQTGRETLYRLLYGTRAAAEALLLQLPAEQAPTLNVVDDVPSPAPALEYEGVRIHSGDLLVSRGGAPTSAFIARGNDYPGNFSHVAIVHVDAQGTAQIIEAHIERGVAIATPEAYFRDKKLRVLVLRLRPDHPAAVANPMLPHEAATAALNEANARHIPYDFAMDFDDPEQQFCSEVASTHYRDLGVTLWETLSSFSSPGLASWMAAFGVEHMQTHSPSDLEYDPALAIVAEWHGRDTLFDDHIDNAVIDAMLEQAEAGAPLDYRYAMLPLARLAKLYSVALNLVGKVGPVPEGMSPAVALRATWLADRHAEIEAEVDEAVEDFETERGRPPAYWELVPMAQEAARRTARR